MESASISTAPSTILSSILLLIRTIGTCIMFSLVLRAFCIRVLSRSEYLCSKKKSQHEDSHELPRILTDRYTGNVMTFITTFYTE